MRVADVKPYPKNAKKHPDKQLEQIANSVKEFGWQQPIVVDREGTIIVGHGRWAAYQKYGLPEPPIQVADLTEEQANAYRLADNKLNESEWDMNLVIEELKDLSEPMVELTGFADLKISPSVIDEISLPDGDKPEYQQITFTLHDNQADIVRKALVAANDAPIIDTDNQNRNGNALYTIAKQWLEQKT